MLNKLYAWKEAYLKNEDGATAIEYGLIAAGISIVIAAVVFTLGDQVLAVFEGLEADMTTAAGRVGE